MFANITRKYVKNLVRVCREEMMLELMKRGLLMDLRYARFIQMGLFELRLKYEGKLLLQWMCAVLDGSNVVV
ncbi:hypothetical protein MKW98_013600 [Papaver atlanticum]|uniref:Uncharacterized protein n=1 Tax=Papaver atlanticum TaxID=357466 RepID=A0AAD4X4R1_9MAGN|nr:hypothetical protein MKW98_013600 [Papaver atlanticum]